MISNIKADNGNDESDDTEKVTAEELESLTEEFEESQRKTKSKYPSHEEMIALNIRKIMGDTVARERMIVGNLPFAYWYASQKNQPGTHAFNETYQVCSIALMRAVDKFDHTLGKFGTYASWWLRQATLREYHNFSSTIRVPIHVRSKLSRIERIVRLLHDALGRDPTLEEISEETGCSMEQLQKNSLVVLFCPSLDAEFCQGGDVGTTYHDILHDPNAYSPRDIAQINDEFRAGIKAIQDLYLHLCRNYSQRDVMIFSRRYGVFGQGPEGRTLEEVGEEFDVTRERVRQICSYYFKKRAKLGLLLNTSKIFCLVIEALRFGLDKIIESGEDVPLQTKWLIGENIE